MVNFDLRNIFWAHVVADIAFGLFYIAAPQLAVANLLDMGFAAKALSHTGSQQVVVSLMRILGLICITAGCYAYGLTRVPAGDRMALAVPILVGQGILGAGLCYFAWMMPIMRTASIMMFAGLQWCSVCMLLFHYAPLMSQKMATKRT